ncbi:helix-turn-helix transcriptional regulator [Halomarina halobia]|uniref:Helix-turn-helix transcriptional regulator n=1 Tax=Halomarina halobia TaxID=3033386 RepID=A0ABD6A6Z6_9EURY|nr:helix-turn-helix domain-containing protein [Halomarina sp. PSR21]
MSRALVVVLFAAILVGSSTVTGVATADASLQTQDFDRTEFDIEVYENGSARWTFVYKRTLDNATQREQFESFASEFNGSETPLYRNFVNRSNRLTAAGSEVTGRQMSAGGFEKRAYVTPIGNQGVVEMSFVWTEFAQTDGERLIVGDVFEGGLYLGPNQRLVVSWDDSLTLVSAAPQPRQQTDGTVVWVGGAEGKQFLNEHPKVVLEPKSAEGNATTDSDPVASRSFGGLGPLWSAGAAVALLAVGAFVAHRFDLFDRFAGFGTGGDGGSGGPTVPPGGTSASERRADRSATVAEPSVPDEALMTDEDRVMDLLDVNGGRMKQVNIVEETGWSKSKVSMLLSEMEEEGYISKLRVGRENIISRAGDEPEATRSPFDDE